MDKLYALLAILIVVYVGINIGNIVDFDSNDNIATDVVDEKLIVVGASSFPAIDNFTDNVVNDTTVSLVDSNKGMTIFVSEIDNSQSIEDITNAFYTNNAYTSSQTINQSGVTTYFLYNEGSDTYDSSIFFNKNGQNYCINGYSISYIESDYFINHCKEIIDTIDINSTS